LQWSREIVCFFPVPSAAPTSVHTSNVNVSSITVQWEAVDCIHQNGNITGYSVRHWVQRSSTHTLNISGGATTAFTLTGLSNSTTYTIDVAAVNNAGIGKYSDAIMVKTIGKICLKTITFRGLFQLILVPFTGLENNKYIAEQYSHEDIQVKVLQHFV